MEATSSVTRVCGFAVVTLGLLAFAVVSPVHGEDPKPGAVPPKEFAQPKEAVDALIDAAAKNDDAALNALAGSGAEDVVQNGRDLQVQKDRAAFADAAKKAVKLEEDPAGVITVVVGEDEWPFPIPLVKAGDKWHFDASEGRQEILARRIGRNELRAIRACREYVEAQIAYASADRDGDRVREYAQRLISTAGSRDGLWWPDVEGSDPSPLAAELPQLKGGPVDPNAAPAPVTGYFWRILTQQGANAPGGAHSYVINGNLIAGFALIGVPAEYRNTGVMTILVSHHGTIHQKDLGAETLAVGAKIDSFDPDSTWAEVDADDIADSAE